MDCFLRAAWHAPAAVHAVTTTRRGAGGSRGAYAAFNLGDHVGDDPQRVAANRAELRDLLALPSEPLWLRQVHGTVVVDADDVPADVVPEADAAVTRAPRRVLAILTADCLPVLFSDESGQTLGAAHAGWRGLAAGVLEATLAAMACAPQQISAWIGPGIRQPAFEVGPEVRERFVAEDRLAFAAFKPSARRQHFLCDLAMLARLRLMRAGLVRIADCGLCTYADPERFYSHRREAPGGRFATLVWREQ
jgi:hypothetical protein